MKNLLLFILGIILVSCGEDKTTPSAPNIDGDNVLTMSISKTAFLLGEDLELTFTKSQAATENINIVLSAKNGADVVEDLFTNFNGALVLPAGERSVSVKFTMISEIVQRETFTIAATARGQEIKPASFDCSLQEGLSTSVSLKGIPNNTVNEGSSFVLKFDLHDNAKDDVVILTTTEADNLEGFPTSLTILKGTQSIESDPVKITRNPANTGDEIITLNFTTTNTNHPLDADNLKITVKEMDKPLGTATEDERHVYEDPSLMYVSTQYATEVSQWTNSDRYKVVSQGDLHPTRPGWKFYTSSEFHRIHPIAQPNDKGDLANTTYSCWGIAAQNVANTQTHAGIDNAKFSTITNDGYLNMWMQKVPTMPTGEADDLTREREYGASGIYSNKFANKAPNVDDDPSTMYGTYNARIFSGVRIETRARMTGAKKGFNFAIWLQGNSHSLLQWPEYGEIDIMENPASHSNNDIHYGTLHYGKRGAGETEANSGHASKSTLLNNMPEWNIYWCELVSEDEVVIGINDQVVLTYTRAQSFIDSPEARWPFDEKVNPGGMHYIITMGAPSTWSLGPNIPADWDSGFASFTNYMEDRYKPELPRMEVDFIRYYYNDNFKHLDKPINETYSY